MTTAYAELIERLQERSGWAERMAAELSNPDAPNLNRTMAANCESLAASLRNAADALAALTRELEETRYFGANELRFAENALIGIEEAFANTGIRVPKSLSAAIGRAARSASFIENVSRAAS